jgi:hypothetical protein
MRTPHLIVIAILAACGSSKQDAPAAGAAGSGSASGSASTRPDSVTAEMAETFELYVTAFEKLTADIEHAGTDCKAVLAAVQRDTKDLDALAPRGDKLREAMAGKKDAAAAAWFATNFTPRMKTSSMKLKPLETACGQDTELKAAVDEAMSKFPMMRKKAK